jgi:hypothetical protein
MKDNSIVASDYMCCQCKKVQAVAFWPVFDPDIPSHPYCRECLDAVKIKMLIELSKTPTK